MVSCTPTLKVFVHFPYPLFLHSNFVIMKEHLTKYVLLHSIYSLEHYSHTLASNILDFLQYTLYIRHPITWISSSVDHFVVWRIELGLVHRNYRNFQHTTAHPSAAAQLQNNYYFSFKMLFGIATA